MKEQTKKRIASALLAGTLLFTTGCTSKNKKNDDNNKVEPPKVVIDVDQNNTKEDKNIVRVHNFAYVTNDTPLYDSKMNEIEVIDKYQRVFVYNITDDMAMGAITSIMSIEEACIRSIKAGCDILLLGNAYEEIEQVIDSIKLKIYNGEISEEHINKSVNRILELKEKYNVME